MKNELHLQRLLILDENILNPLCHVCDKELSAFLISQQKLINSFTPEDIGFLTQKKLLRQSKNYKPNLIIFLCRMCCQGKEL